MKKSLLVLLFLTLSSGATFASASLNLCRTGESIKNLYSGAIDYSGMNKKFLASRKVIQTIDNEKEKDELSLLNNFEFVGKGKKLYITSKNLSFKQCVEIDKACEGYKDLPKYSYSAICTPIGSKVNLTLE